MDRPRDVIFHRSANRPHLLLGCDRELALSAIFICAILAFSLMTVWGVFVAGAVWAIFMAVLSRMGKADPMLRQVYIRHVKYHPFYPAKSPKDATAETMPLQWR
jgi:type IV secretion system protein VirB3